MKKFFALFIVGLSSFGIAYYGQASIDPRPSLEESVDPNCLQPEPAAELRAIADTAVVRLDLQNELKFAEGKPSLYFKEGEVSTEEKKFTWWEGTPVCSLTLAHARLVRDPRKDVALRPGVQQLALAAFPSAEFGGYVMLKGEPRAGIPDYVLHCEGRSGNLTIQNLSHAFGKKLKVCKTDQSTGKIAKRQ